MENWVLTIWWLLFVCSYGVSGYSTHEPARACGDHLADVLALVCKDRGYNVYFPPDDSYVTERRYKRGIVEECCHSGCSYHTLEQYCKPITTETPDNSQIRKRSDNDKSWQSPADNKPADPLPITKNLFSHFHQRFNYGKHQTQEQPQEDKNLRDISTDDQPQTSSNYQQKDNLLENLFFSKTDNEDRDESSNNENGDETTDSKSVKKLLLTLRIKTNIENAEKNSNVQEEKRISGEIFNSNERDTFSKEIVQNNNRMNDEEPSNDGDSSYLNRRHRNSFDSQSHSDRVRHNHYRHHQRNATSRRNNHTQKDDTQQNNNSNRFSRVGIVNPYFLGKELVHPNVRPSVNFTVNNIRQPLSSQR